MTTTVEQTIEVNVPIGTAYNQWTQHPEERVAWRNIDGKDNAGVVTFHKIDDATTRIAVQFDFVPEGLAARLNRLRDYAYPLSQRAWALTGRAGEQLDAETVVRRQLQP